MVRGQHRRVGRSVIGRGHRGRRERQTIRYYQRRGLMPEPAAIQRTAPLCGRRRQTLALHQAGAGARLHAGRDRQSADAGRGACLCETRELAALKLRHRQTARRPQGDAQGADFAVARMRNRISNWRLSDHRRAGRGLTRQTSPPLAQPVMAVASRRLTLQRLRVSIPVMNQDSLRASLPYDTARPQPRQPGTECALGCAGTSRTCPCAGPAR